MPLKTNGVALVVTVLLVPLVAADDSDPYYDQSVSCAHELAFYKGCFAYLSYLYVNCPDGYDAIDAYAFDTPEARCGFLGEKGRCWPDWDPRDHGCGCDQGWDCLNKDCEETEWSDWGHCVKKSNECNPNVLEIGTQIRTRAVKSAAEYDGNPCGELEDTRECTSQDCPVDCEVGEWSEWGSCSAQCAGGIRKRTRAITVPRKSYGEACPDLEEIQACNESPCYWFYLRGRTGNEQVKILEAAKSQTKKYTLRNPKKIGLNSQRFYIEFPNGNGKNDVTFKFKEGSSGKLQCTTLWKEWNCGASNENERCEKVRKGNLAWEGLYLVEFYKKSTFSGEYARDYEDTQIFNNHGTCLDVKQLGTKGSDVQTYSCWEERVAHQTWTFEPDTGFIKTKDGLCLDAAQRNTKGGKVHIHSCKSGNKNQHWTYTLSTGRIKSTHGICLDANGSKQGGKVHMWTCNQSNANQQWTISHGDVISGTGEGLSG